MQKMRQHVIQHPHQAVCRLRIRKICQVKRLQVGQKIQIKRWLLSSSFPFFFFVFFFLVFQRLHRFNDFWQNFFRKMKFSTNGNKARCGIKSAAFDKLKTDAQRWEIRRWVLKRKWKSTGTTANEKRERSERFEIAASTRNNQWKRSPFFKFGLFFHITMSVFRSDTAASAVSLHLLFLPHLIVSVASYRVCSAVSVA